MFVSDFKNVFNLFFPKRCFLCKSNILLDEFLCPDCHSLCHLHPNPNFLSKNYNTGALFYYELTMRKLILKSKFNNEYLSLQILKNIILNQLTLGRGIQNLLSYQPSVITYIPTHWRSRFFRGYDLPEVFAQILAKLIKIPVIELLSLRKYKKKQSSMRVKSQRLSAVKEAFILKNTNKTFARILIVDDIITTGATLYEAIKVLKSLSSDIRGFAIAKTP